MNFRRKKKPEMYFQRLRAGRPNERGATVYAQKMTKPESARPQFNGLPFLYTNVGDNAWVTLGSAHGYTWEEIAPPGTEVYVLVEDWAMPRFFPGRTAGLLADQLEAGLR